MKVSVIIPTFNYGHLIVDTIDSIKRQTHANWEIIIVDDGSKDNTELVVNTYVATDSRIRFFKQHNAGPSAARNLALAEATGDFIQFLDADDLLEPRKFEQQLALFQQKPTTDIVYSRVRYFTQNPTDEKKWLLTYWGENREWMPGISGHGPGFLPGSLKGSFGHISCFLFRKRIVDKAGHWDESKRAAEDYLFVLNCVLADGHFLFEDRKGSYALVRWHGNNASRHTRWIHEAERQMRLELVPRLAATGNTEAIRVNGEAIRALELMTGNSWRKKFLSGGPFDLLKKGLRRLGLEKWARRIFYK